MEVRIEKSWNEALQAEFLKDYFVQLTDFVRSEYRQHTCYPPGSEIFNAFNLCPLDRVKVVILGQDPYHGPGQAEGLCFSVKTGVELPPSLVNIFKEVKADVGSVPAVVSDARGRQVYDGSLRRWAEQGGYFRGPGSHRVSARQRLSSRIHRCSHQRCLCLPSPCSVLAVGWSGSFKA